MAVIGGAGVSRDRAILLKENAIKAKLNKYNQTNKTSAQTKLNKTVADYGKKKPPKSRTFTQQYATQSIKGADKGFSKSDYGVGAGAAIPYQIGSGQSTASATYNPPGTKPKPKPTNKFGAIAIADRLKNLNSNQAK